MQKLTGLTYDQAFAIRFEVAGGGGGFGKVGNTVAEVGDVAEAIATMENGKAAHQAHKRAMGARAICPQYDSVLRKLRRLIEEG